MPYSNIHWIKLQLEILNDKRFIFDCDNDQKWFYIGLLLLAGSTNNQIPDDENFLKNRLNLPENSSKIRENIAFLLKTFPKMISKNGVIKFKNFNKLHNRLGNSEGTPEELQRGVQIREEQNKIREEYIRLKGFDPINLSSNDYGRMGRAIKTLLTRANGNTDLVMRGLQWQAKQPYSWTLETLDKKWLDFMKPEKPEGAGGRELERP